MSQTPPRNFGWCPVHDGAPTTGPRGSQALGALALRGVVPHSATRSPTARLTRAEREVSVLVAEGATNPEIARALGLSRHTVESHLRHIYVKFGFTSRVQLAVLITREIGRELVW